MGGGEGYKKWSRNNQCLARDSEYKIHNIEKIGYISYKTLLNTTFQIKSRFLENDFETPGPPLSILYMNHKCEDMWQQRSAP